MKMLSTRYAIIGSGPAALFAAEAIRKRDAEGKLLMFGAEGYPPYSRPLTSYYLAGLVPKEKLFLRTADFYRQKKIEFIAAKVTEVKGKEKILAYQPLNEKEKGEASQTHAVRFEKLLIASGADPVKPDIPGINMEGVYTLRTIDDAEAIAQRAGKGKRALLLGGGLVSLKAAYALHKLGLEITLIVSSNRILSQMLDKEGAEIVAARLAENGLVMHFQSDVREIHGNGAGVKGVTLADSRELETDLVIVGKGVKPVTSFLEGSGLAVENGIPTGEQLQTNLPDIYAAGDVALCRDMVLMKPANNALWPSAAEQGEIAGANMSGEQLSYSGSIRMNATEFFGLPVIAAGLGTVQRGEGTPWEIYQVQFPRHAQKREPRYLKLVFQEERLVGYVSIGENRKAGMLTGLITGRQPLSRDRKERLINGDLSYL